jgi:hypothetical protein
MTYLRSLLLGLAVISSLNSVSQLICGLQGVNHAEHECQLIALEEDKFTFVPPPAGFDPTAPRSATISVTFNGMPANAQLAFDYAVDIWAMNLTSDVVITIEANWANLGGSVLGFAGPVDFERNFVGAIQANTWFPAALANKLNGSDLNPGAFDITCTFNSNTNWYFGTDGNTPGGQYDFVSVVLHELGHGLGFTGSADVSGGLGFIGQLGSPFIYDKFVEEFDATPIISYSTGTSALENALTSNQLYWNGPLGMAGNAGNRPRLYAPGSWNGGSSYSHLNESTYGSGNQNSLMTPFLGSAEAIHTPGPITYGMFEDMGWDVGGCAITNVTAGVQFTCDPVTNTYTQQLIVEYENPPAIGQLSVNGNLYPIFTSPQNVNLISMPADGQAVSVDVFFTLEATCSASYPDLYFAQVPCCSTLRMVEVDTDNDEITLENFGSCNVDVSNYQLCSQGVCESISNMTVTAGSIDIAPGSTATFQWAAWTPNPAGDDMALHIPGADLLDPDDLVDYVQWQNSGNVSEALAVSKGIWGVGDFVGDFTPFFYTGNGIQTGVFWWDGSPPPPPPCIISGLFAGTQGSCDPVTNEYTQQVVILFADAPATGTLDLNGQSFPFTFSPAVVDMVGLISDGLPVDVTASFSDDASCPFTANALFVAPPSCLSACPTDLNGDNVTDVLDLLALLAEFGCTSGCLADFNEDGSTTAADLLPFLASYGTSCD